ncbi:MAG: peptidoglycan-binding protein [Acidobacteria bacterium]|nr:peptidoglycan-binding protein [Acidobacteriota bacterium]MBV9477559.1 peptidoglycan-binding protein [Acidobacteriota bacterium]
MARLLFDRGARGAIIADIQQHLADAGHHFDDIDGIYGQQTASSVQSFQQAKQMPVTGSIDTTTWTSLTNEPIPSLEQRCLDLTSTFEGHGFTLAQGNFDGAGITWGIIGFTLQAGEITQLVEAACAQDAAFVRDCFGDQTDALLAMLKEAWPQQLAWADSVSLGSQKATLAEPWKSGFAKLGGAKSVQQLQLDRVRAAYFQPALSTAADFDLTTELGVALCFDIHVQNGGIHQDAAKEVRAQLKAGMSEEDIRVLIANAVADHANEAWREDVRNRKLTIAKGNGVVHGITAVLRNWGLDEVAAT